MYYRRDILHEDFLSDHRTKHVSIEDVIRPILCTVVSLHPSYPTQLSVQSSPRNRLMIFAKVVTANLTIATLWALEHLPIVARRWVFGGDF